MKLCKTIQNWTGNNRINKFFDWPLQKFHHWSAGECRRERMADFGDLQDQITNQATQNAVWQWIGSPGKWALPTLNTETGAVRGSDQSISSDNFCSELKRIREVLALFAHEGCRYRWLSKHFGADLERDCGHCSWCIDKTTVKITYGHLFSVVD